MKNILVASDKSSVTEGIRACLGKEYKVAVAGDLNGCLNTFRQKRYEFTYLDIDLLRQSSSGNGQINYKEALQLFWKISPTAMIIVLAPQSHIREAVFAVKAGATNYLTYPLDPVEVKFVTESQSEFLKIESELLYLRETSIATSGLEGTRTNSSLMKEVLSKMSSVTPTRTTVLLTGETGTGKGVYARLIHAQSNRAEKPFIAVHCGAIPDTLVESELFGHEKGAFTGAVKRKMGKFQIADGGTIFLDEIATISPAVQIKLLQVLQDRNFTRVGGDSPIEVDVRIIAATNVDLDQLCDEGTFRRDLYYRLNVFPVELPPLRERKEDIPLLVETFLQRLNRMYASEVKGVEPEVVEALKGYSWPGNIRELENLIERAYILEKSSFLSASSFPAELFTYQHLQESTDQHRVPTLAEVKRRAVEQMEKRYLRDLLTLSRGRIGQSATMAGITTRQLHNLLVKYGLRKEDYR